MDPWDGLVDILLLLLGALVLGALLERLRQSAVVGFILAGMILGPNSLDLVSSRQGVEALAELGVSLLLFSVGLEFSGAKLASLRAAGRLGVLQVIGTTIVGALAAVALGLGWREAIGLGAILSLSSTACVLRVLTDRSQLDSGTGRNALGVLLVQDVAVIPLAFLMEFLALGGSGEQGVIGPISLIAIALAFGAALWALLRFIAPLALGSRILSGNRELSLLLAVVSGLGAAGGAHSIDVSPALGAFIAGIVLAGSPFAVQVRSDVASLRTLLLTLFFGSVGMLADPKWIFEHIGPLLALLAALVVGKSVAVATIIRIASGTWRNGIATGLALAQIGEFSFLLATLGRDAVLSAATAPYLVSTTILSLLITPYLVAFGPRLERALVRGGSEEPDEATAPAAPADVLVIGFGPSGQQAAAEIARRGPRVLVVDLNSASVLFAREFGYQGIVGDASHPEVLEHLELGGLKLVVITLPDPASVERALESLARIRPGCPVVVRLRYHRHRRRFEGFPGVHLVDEEEEVGRSLGAVAAEALRAQDGKKRKPGRPPVEPEVGEAVALREDL